MVNWIRMNIEERWAEEEARKIETDDTGCLLDQPWQPPEEKARQRKEQFKRGWTF